MLKSKKVIIFVFVLMLLIVGASYKLVINLRGTVLNYDILQKNPDDSVNLKYNDVLTQSFSSDKNHLFLIEVMLNNNVSEKDSIKAEYGIKDYTTSEILYKNEISIPGIQNKMNYVFNIPELSNSEGGRYVFYVKNLQADGELNFWKSNKDLYDKGVLKVNDSELTGDLNFRMGFNGKYPYAYKAFFVVFIISLVILLGFFVLNKYFINLEKSFLILALVFGVFMIFLVPPFQVPDEIVHFYRAYEVSQGDFIPSRSGDKVGSNMPEGICEFVEAGNYEMIPAKYNEKLDIDNLINSSKVNIDNNKTKFVHVGGASIYMPIQYFPQAAGLLIGKVFNLPVLFMFYLGRLFNMLVWVALTYLALKIIPFGKKVLFLIALIPMVIQQAASMSPDGLLIGISFLFTSYCLHLAFVKEKVDIKDIIKIVIMSMMIISMKVVYTPLILLLTLINAKKFKHKWDLILLVIGMIVAGGLINVLWVNAVSFVNTVATPSPNVNSVQQIKYVLHYPFGYIYTLFNTFIQSSEFYAESLVGILGWLDYSLPYPLIYSYIFLIIFNSIANDEKEEFKISNIQKGILLFTSLSIIILVITSLYVAWTDVGTSKVSGVQGRYFIPIILSLLLAFANNKVTIKSRNLYQYLIGYEIWVFAYTVIMVMSRYYITIT